MGWSNGSSILCEVIEAIEEHAHADSDKVSMFEAIIAAFEDADCDTTGECLAQSSAFDEAYARLHPDETDDWLEVQEAHEIIHDQSDEFDITGRMCD